MKRIQPGRGRRFTRTALPVLLATPLLAGGCPDVRNGVLDALESATVFALTDRSEQDTPTIFQNDFMRSLVGIFYDELRIERVQ